jgi:hypothetical protein
MKRLALVLACAAAVALPGATRAAACSPLNCAASQFTLAHGTMMGFRTAANTPVTVVDLTSGKAKFALPAGVNARNYLLHLEGQTVEWYDLTLGTKVQSISVAAGYSLRGASQDGTRAVLQQADNGGATFLVVSKAGQQTVHVDGTQWDFDALRGGNLFLIHYLTTGGYQVRLAHLASGRLEAKPLKDPHESGTIWGQPFSRLASANGQFLFTVFIGSNGGAMIHELDLKNSTARCIDLPGTGDYGAATTWTLQLAANGETLWAVNPRYGRVVAIDVAARAVKAAFRIRLVGWFLGKGTSSVLAPDGNRIALADGESVAILDLGARKITSRTSGVALALGYSPDGAKLWKLA